MLLSSLRIYQQTQTIGTSRNENIVNELEDFDDWPNLPHIIGSDNYKLSSTGSVVFNFPPKKKKPVTHNTSEVSTKGFTKI